jgi:hypothetical protein
MQHSVPGSRRSESGCNGPQTLLIPYDKGKMLYDLVVRHGGATMEVFPDSPDLVVKSQHIDIIDVILPLVLRPHVVYQREIKG